MERVGLMFVDREVSAVPCAHCRGPVIEFAVAHEVWNAVVRGGGPEGEGEYLCVWCYAGLASAWIAGRLLSAEGAGPGGSRRPEVKNNGEEVTCAPG